MGILFINGSPNKNGNTAHIAKTLLKDHKYQTLDLVDYRLYSYGRSSHNFRYRSEMNNGAVITMEAKRQINSILHKLPETIKIFESKENSERYTSQITLAKRRVRAFEFGK